MKLLLKLITMSMLLLLVTNVLNADVQVTVYGRGGIIVKPDNTTIVCPIYDPNQICAEITVESENLSLEGSHSGLAGTLYHEGGTYNVIVIELPNLTKNRGNYSCQGLVVHSLKPIK